MIGYPFVTFIYPLEFKAKRAYYKYLYSLHRRRKPSTLTLTIEDCIRGVQNVGVLKKKGRARLLLSIKGV